MFLIVSVILFILFRELGIIYGKLVDKKEVRELRIYGAIFVTGFIINAFTDILTTLIFLSKYSV